MINPLNFFDSNKKSNENIMNNSFCYINKNPNMNDKQLMKRIIEEYKQQIKNMNECLKFNEENYEAEIKLIKKQITNFINENISLKTSNDKLLIENNYKFGAVLGFAISWKGLRNFFYHHYHYQNNYL